MRTIALAALLPLTLVVPPACGGTPEPEIAKNTKKGKKNAKADSKKPAKGKKTKGKKKGKKKKGKKGKKKGKKGKKKGKKPDANLKKKLDEADERMLFLKSKEPIDFMGVELGQLPTDTWLMAELIHKLRPDYIVEAGTRGGGTAIFYSGMLELSKPRGKVLTIGGDESKIKPEAKEHSLWKRVVYYEGTSDDEALHKRLRTRIARGKAKTVIATVTAWPKGRKRLARDLNLFAELVTVGSYMIVQDTFYEGMDKTIKTFLKTHKNWKRDKALDKRFGISRYRGGFLVKKSEPGEEPAKDEGEGKGKDKDKDAKSSKKSKKSKKPAKSDTPAKPKGAQPEGPLPPG